MDVWDYRAQERFRRSYDRDADIDLVFRHTPFTGRLLHFTSRMGILRRFFEYRSLDRFYREQLDFGHKAVNLVRRQCQILIKAEALLGRRIVKAAGSSSKYYRLKKQLIGQRSRLYRLPVYDIFSSFRSRSILKTDRINSVSPLLLIPSFIQRVLRFNYQIRHVLMPDVYSRLGALFVSVSSDIVLAQNLVNSSYLTNQIFSQTKRGVDGD